jgi:hypothetical protein
MALIDRGYFAKARQALDELKNQWGEAAFAQYQARNDAKKLIRPLLQLTNAIH